MFLTLVALTGIGVEQMRRFIFNVVGMWAVALSTGFAQTTVPDETGLWQVWVSQTNAATDHAAVAQACAAFRSKAPTDALAVVAQGLEAWHLLKAGKTNEAVQLLGPMVALSGDAMQKAGAEMARGWLTRLDREAVRAALKRAYQKDVEFPATLERIKTLKKMSMPPFEDRWGQAWSYQTTELATIKGTPRQRYVLESTRLGAESDLTGALAVPYGSRITVAPVRVMGGEGAGETVEFAAPGGKSGALTVGTGMEGVTFAFNGKSIIVLADRDHWRVVARPR